MTERAQTPKSLPGWVWGGLIGCAVVMSWMSWNSSGAEQKLRESFGGEQHLQCARNASRIYATRLGLAPGVEVPQRLEDFVAVAEPIELSEKLRVRIPNLLTGPSSYDWRNENRKCLPLYAYRLRFLCDDSSLEAMICLRCGVVEFIADGKRVGGGVLNHPSKLEIQQLSKELFPGDPELEQESD